MKKIGAGLIVLALFNSCVWVYAEDDLDTALHKTAEPFIKARPIARKSGRPSASKNSKSANGAPRANHEMFASKR